MSVAGFCLMSLSLAFVVLLNIYCFVRVLRTKPRREAAGATPSEERSDLND